MLWPSQWSKWSPRRFGTGEPVLGLALELRLADEDGQHQLGADHHVVGGDIARLFLPDQLAELAKPADQRLAQPLFVGAAIRSGDCVAIPGVAAVAP
jgi:hypothetical protein